MISTYFISIEQGGLYPFGLHAVHDTVPKEYLSHEQEISFLITELRDGAGAGRQRGPADDRARR